MKVGVNLLNWGPGVSPDSLMRWATLVEALGYHLVMISDHVAPTPDVASKYPAPIYDPLTTLGWLAASAGDSVRVRVSAGEQRQVLAVPESVVFSQQRKQYVYVVADGKAQLREVETGAAFDGMVEVNRRASSTSTTGLDENDTVIADNLLRVRPGIPVTVK